MRQHRKNTVYTMFIGHKLNIKMFQEWVNQPALQEMLPICGLILLILWVQQWIAVTFHCDQHKQSQTNTYPISLYGWFTSHLLNNYQSTIKAFLSYLKNLNSSTVTFGRIYIYISHLTSFSTISNLLTEIPHIFNQKICPKPTDAKSTYQNYKQSQV